MEDVFVVNDLMFDFRPSLSERVGHSCSPDDPFFFQKRERQMELVARHSDAIISIWVI